MVYETGNLLLVIILCFDLEGCYTLCSLFICCGLFSVNHVLYVKIIIRTIKKTAHKRISN